jgi:phage-related protein
MFPGCLPVGRIRGADATVQLGGGGACVALQRWYIGMTWKVEYFSAEVKASLDALPQDIRAKFERIVELMQSNGLERLPGTYVRHLAGPVWEMRMAGKHGIARAAYVTATGWRIVVVHVFRKKTQKTPRREIDTALRRAREVR